MFLTSHELAASPFNGQTVYFVTDLIFHMAALIIYMLASRVDIRGRKCHSDLQSNLP